MEGTAIPLQSDAYLLDDSRANLAADVDKIMSYVVLSEPLANAALPTEPFP